MKPVEIEFIMRDNLTSGLDKAGRQVKSLETTAEGAAKSLTERIAAQREQIAHVEKDLKSLTKRLAAMGPGKAQQEMRAEVEACTKALAEDRNILAELEARHTSTGSSATRLSKELRALQDEMAQMRLAGRQNSEEYATMAQRAAELADTIGDLRTQTNILAHDDAGLQGVISGVNGLSGAFTVATGLMGVFASENEDLAKIQTRVQSVMAVTMGLQQVMNTLNKDSAFRLVTLTKAKNLFATANTRLATAMGISRTAATALIGTLTLGLSVAVTGAIALWEKYSTAQEEAARKTRELQETEADARASMVKNRFELEMATKSLKDFNGSKDQEKVKVDELNRKYGESFGYYNSIAQWYDVLTSKGEAYTRMMFNQAKMQSLMNKAVDADKEVERLKSLAPDNAETSMGWFKKAMIWIGQSASQGQIDAEKIIRKHNEESLAAALSDAQKVKDGLMDQMRALFDENATIAKGNGLGGFSSDGPDGTSLKAVNDLADLELKARQKIEDQKIELMRAGYERERAQAALNFEREKERINKEEQQRLELYAQLKAAGENVTPEQKNNIIAQAAAQRTMAAALYDATLEDIDRKEARSVADRMSEQTDALNSLLSKYADFEAQRTSVTAEANKDIAALNAARTEANSAEIDRAIEVAKTKMAKGLQEINDAEAAEAADGNDFIKSLFGDYASMSMSELSRMIEQARILRDYLNGNEGSEGITFISADQLAALESSPAELDKLKKALDKLLNGDSGKESNKWQKVFEDFRKGIAGLGNAKGPKAIAESVIGIGRSAAVASGEISEMLDALGNTNAADAMDNVQTLLSGISNIAEGFSKGGVVGGMGAILGELMSSVTNIFSAEVRHREALKEIAAAQLDFQRQYNLALMEQNLLLEEAENIFGERKIAKAANAVNVYREAVAALKSELSGEAPEKTWLEKATNDFAGTYANRLTDYQNGIGGLASAQIVTGHKKTGLFGWGKGKDVYSSLLSVYPELIKANGELDTEMLRVILDTRKMSDETRSYLENLISLQEEIEAAEEQLESYLNDAFGSLGGGVMDAVVQAVKGSEGALDSLVDYGAARLEELGQQVAYSLFFADKFDELQDQLKAVYGSGKSEENIANDAMSILGDFYAGIGENVEQAQSWMEAWQSKAAELGFDLWKSDSASQSGKAGVFSAMTQDQGTKLEGLFTSVRAHEANIDENVESVAEGLQTAVGHLRSIDNNTKETSERLGAVADLLEKFDREGIEVR